MTAVANEWLNAANDDLLVIEAIIANESIAHMVAFHAQQCIEKCFKAVLEDEEIDIPKIHSLGTLYSIVSDHINLNLEHNDPFAILKVLDQLYIDARYPGAFGLLPNGKPTQQDAQQFYNLAKDIYLVISSGSYTQQI